MATRVGGSGSSGSTLVTGGSGSDVFTEFRRVVQTVADALATPTDTPSLDTERVVEDATGLRMWWSFRASTNTWKGMQPTGEGEP